MQLTEEIRTIFIYSRDEAMRTGCYAIAPEHLLLGILRHGNNSAVELFKQFGLEPAEVKTKFDEKVFCKEAVPFSQEDEVTFTRSALNVASMALMEAMRVNEDVEAIHLLSALCDCPGSWHNDYLNSHGLSLQLIRTIRKKACDDSKKKSAIPSSEELNSLLSAFYSDKDFFS